MDIKKIFSTRYFVHFVNIAVFVMFFYPWIELPFTDYLVSDTKTFSIFGVASLLISGGDFGIDFSSLIAADNPYHDVFSAILLFLAIGFFLFLGTLYYLFDNEWTLFWKKSSIEDTYKKLKRSYSLVIITTLYCWIIICILQYAISHEVEYEIGDKIIGCTSLLYIILFIAIIMRFKYLNICLKECERKSESDEITPTTNFFLILQICPIVTALFMVSKWFHISLIEKLFKGDGGISVPKLISVSLSSSKILKTTLDSFQAEYEQEGSILKFLAFLFCCILLFYVVCFVKLIKLEIELLFSKNRSNLVYSAEKTYKLIGILYLVFFAVTFLLQLYIGVKLEDKLAELLFGYNASFFIFAIVIYFTRKVIKENIAMLHAEDNADDEVKNEN